jgi:hypothetical protein
MPNPLEEEFELDLKNIGTIINLGKPDQNTLVKVVVSGPPCGTPNPTGGLCPPKTHVDVQYPPEIDVVLKKQ